MLTMPNIEVRATQLESLRTGIHEKVASGSKGQVIDPQAKREFQQRLADLAEDIEEAEGFNDVGRLEHLQAEREQLMETLRTTSGMNGDIREDYDADRSRNTVSRSIRRAINAVTEEHPALGRHLDDSIRLGLRMAYSPAEPIDWVF